MRWKLNSRQQITRSHQQQLQQPAAAAAAKTLDSSQMPQASPH
jgi:hypothetical protein